jgi:hypothetical protein
MEFTIVHLDLSNSVPIVDLFWKTGATLEPNGAYAVLMPLFFRTSLPALFVLLSAFQPVPVNILGNGAAGLQLIGKWLSPHDVAEAAKRLTSEAVGQIFQGKYEMTA